MRFACIADSKRTTRIRKLEKMVNEPMSGKCVLQSYEVDSGKLSDGVKA